MRWFESSRPSIALPCASWEGLETISNTNNNHEDLKLHMHIVEGMQVFELSGSLDIATSPTVRASLLEASARGDHRLIVDLTNVDFLDSTGLGVLVGGLKRVRAHDGSLELVCTQERILKIFRITGLTKVFGIYSSVEEAKEAHGRDK